MSLPRPRTALAAAAGLLAVVSLAACSSGGTSPTSSAGTEIKYTINAAPASKGLDLGFWAAYENGYFADEGVRVNVTEVETPKAGRDALIAGQVDIAHVSISTSLPAFEADSPLLSVGVVYQRWPETAVVSNAFLAKKGLTAAQFEALPLKQRYLDLQGASIALAGPGDILDQTIRAQLKYFTGADPDSFVTFQYLQSTAAQEASFQAGTVDAYFNQEPAVDWFADKGDGAILASGDEQFAQIPQLVIPAGNEVVNTNWLDADPSHKDALRAYLAAWVKGNYFIKGLTEDQLRDWVLKLNSDVTDPDAQDRLVQVASWTRTGAAWDGRVSDGLIQRTLDFGFNTGSVKTHLDIDKIRDFEYLPSSGDDDTPAPTPVKN